MELDSVYTEIANLIQMVVAQDYLAPLTSMAVGSAR